MITSAACLSALLALCSPSAAITFFIMYSYFHANEVLYVTLVQRFNVAISDLYVFFEAHIVFHLAIIFITFALASLIMNIIIITSRFTFALASLAASASAAIALINWAGTRTSFTWNS